MLSTSSLYLGAAIAAIGAAFALLYAVTMYRFLIPPPRRALPILMYHKLSPQEPHKPHVPNGRNGRDTLTVTTADFAAHLRYLRENGYTAISFRDLLLFHQAGTLLPPKPVLLTFDDAYQNNYDLALPLLKAFGMKATIFLPVGYLGKTNVWDDGGEPLMSIDALRRLAKESEAVGCAVEFGLHSFAHQDYRTMTIEEIDADLSQCIQTLHDARLAFAPVLAYPFGGVPKDPTSRLRLNSLLQQHGIVLAVRIKNRINRLPLAEPYAVTRTTISGRDALWEFSIKVRKGSLRLF